IFKLTQLRYGLDAVVGRLLQLMREQLDQSARSFEYVLLDCPPDISALTEVSIRLADLVIVPTIPDFLLTFGLQAFCNSLWKGPVGEGSSLPRPKKLPHVLVTRRRPIREHARIIQMIRNEVTATDPAFIPLNAEVPEAAAIAEALGKAGAQ